MAAEAAYFWVAWLERPTPELLCYPSDLFYKGSAVPLPLPALWFVFFYATAYASLLPSCAEAVLYPNLLTHGLGMLALTSPCFAESGRFAVYVVPLFKGCRGGFCGS